MLMTPLQVIREVSNSPSNSSDWSGPDMENHPPVGSPASTTGAQSAGRVLYCRKCEGHGEKVVLKNHTPNCPYILCTCKSCERLNQKRLKSFSKRNKDKLKLAAELCEQRRLERESRRTMNSRKVSSSSTATTSSNEADMDSDSSPTRTGIENRSMSLGAMTVMSYDIWKAKCAADKKKKEEERKASLASQTLHNSDMDDDLKPISRKRANTTICPLESYKDIPKISPPNVKEKKGRYILLPTIPAMKVFVDDEGSNSNNVSTSNASSSASSRSTPSDVNMSAAVATVASPVSSSSLIPSTTSSPAIQHPTPVTTIPVSAQPTVTTIPGIPATASPLHSVSTFPTVTSAVNFLPPQSSISQVPISSMSTATPVMSVPTASGLGAPFLFNTQASLPRDNVNLTMPQTAGTAPIMSTDQLLSILNPQVLLHSSLLQQQAQQAQQQQHAQQQQNACIQQLLNILSGSQTAVSQVQPTVPQVQIPTVNPGQPDLLAILRGQQQLHQACQSAAQQQQQQQHQHQQQLFLTSQAEQLPLSSASDDLLKTLLAMRQQPIFSNPV